MLKDLYAVLDFTKTVRFQTGTKEDTNTDACDNVDNVTIYDNYWAEGSTAPKLQDDATKDQQQATSVSVSSGKRTLLRASAVFLGLLCLLLLAAVIVLAVLSIQDKINWNLERYRLWVDNANLTSERNELLTNYNETKIHNHNLTQRMSHLEHKNELLKAKNNNLSSEKEELQEHINTSSCPDQWIKFDSSCYFFSTSKKNWINSRRTCEELGAQLVIISSKEEQKLISLFNRRTWIGLTDRVSEGDWIWVNGLNVTTVYWRNGQPDNDGQRAENCAEILPQNNELNNWNDVSCTWFRHFSCEKIPQS